MKVSVVVPVFNTGPYITDLIESLRVQTLDPSQFEVVFVDDGSTDGTPALLDRVAADTPNIRVLHTPNSGWPGRPRNIGIDAAVGEYIFLSDHDDRLDPAALERLTAFADRHASDVVVGRIIGVGRPAPSRIFARTVVDAQDDPELLMTSLTPQKLYRRAFLIEQGIRFPEGERRLEDHLFVTKAYVRAARVSVYADHPVYYFVLRDDGQNASRRRVEWRGYFANAAESIAVVDAEVTDAHRRVVMRRRWLRNEALSRLRGPGFADRTVDRDVLVAAAGELLRRHYPLAEIDLLDARDRVAARLAIAGDEAGLDAFARWEASVRARPHLEAARVDRQGARIEARIRVDQHATQPRPPFLLQPPEGWPPADAFDDVERMAPSSRATVVLRQVGSGLTVPLTVRQAVEDGELTAVAAVDLHGVPTVLRDGRWVLQVRFRGLTDKIRGDDLIVAPADRDAVAGDLVRFERHLLRLSVADAGRLSLRVNTSSTRSLARRVTGGALRRLGLRPA